MSEILKLVALAIFSAFLLGAAIMVHEAGKPAKTMVDDYFIQNTQEETGSNNAVTAVVFDYRGMDTLIEASVLFAAATGVFLAIGGRKNEGK